jgi:hypothetical protein
MQLSPAEQERIANLKPKATPYTVPPDGVWLKPPDEA